MENDNTNNEAQNDRRPPRGAVGFVAIFIVVALGLLLTYHYTEDTAINRQYLEITTKSTAMLLGIIGDSAEVITSTEWPGCRFVLQEGKTASLVVAPECGAIEVMAIFLAAVVAFPTLWRKKILGLLIGFPILYALNVFRVFCLFIIAANDPTGRYLDFVHHYVWQTVYIIFVVMVWLAWVRYIVEHKRQESPEA